MAISQNRMDIWKHRTAMQVLTAVSDLHKLYIIRCNLTSPTMLATSDKSWSEKAWVATRLIYNHTGKFREVSV